MGKKFKFDVVIGNPPYQEETTDVEADSNRQKPVKNIFQFFQESADSVAENNTVLIYPGARWIHQFGKGLKSFGHNQINDPHLKILYFYPNANEVFPEIQMADGITIVIKDMHKSSNEFDYVYVKNGVERRIRVTSPGNELMLLNPDDINICNKIDLVVKDKSLTYLHDGILPRSLFRIESSFVEDNPNLVLPYSEGKKYDTEKYVKVFTNDKAGKTGRAKWFLVEKKALSSNKEYIDQWQVVVSSANAGGQKRDNQIEIIDNHSAFGRSRVALKSFKSQKEAINFFNYAKSYLVRYTFLMTDESLTSLGKRVPDLVDYTDANKYIDSNFAGK